jgi:hypothetical protein
MKTNKIIKLMLLVGVVIFVMAIFKKNKLPGIDEIFENLFTDPIQTETNIAPFEVRKDKFIYRIEPLYNYELYGLVVSYNDSSKWYDYYHKQSNDFINIKDIGVLWGENIKNEIYKYMTFSSGSWTLYCDFKSGTTREIWSKFKNECMSNNHLLPGSSEIKDTIKEVRKGDQIYLKGYLVKYSHSGWDSPRGTSTTRADTGGSACETIFVTEFEILKRSNIFWNVIYKISKYLIILCLSLLFILFIKNPVTPPS